jgi:aminoglycoside 3-N-acetyltransferase
MSASSTSATLTAQLRALGLRRGDTIFAHTSFSALGAVEGGAAAVLAAFDEALGPEVHRGPWSQSVAA